MKAKKLLFICFSTLLVLTEGCSEVNGKNAVNSGSSSIPDIQFSKSSSSVSSETSSTKSIIFKTTSSQPGNSESTISESTSSNPKGNSKWVAYTTNKDSYKLHLKKEDGSEDKVIVNDPVLAPCVAGEWVYYIDPLIEIDKVNLDGSQKTKVCDIPEIMEINGSTAVTAEYKDGYILYKTQQLHEVGDNSSYPPYYYKLDPATNKISEVKNQ